MNGRNPQKSQAEDQVPAPAPKCGIVMPISRMDDCDEGHWLEVKELISRAATTAGFMAELVSNDNETGVIQKRIVQNLYECPIIVCDVSCKNPNVMLELGMRLAFDKPVILIKDNVTSFSFDTSPLEHLIYPRELRFAAMEKFMAQLSAKIKKSAESVGSNSFLASFGTFQTAEIDVQKAPAEQVLLGRMSELESLVRQVLLSGSGRQGNDSSTTSRVQVPINAVRRTGGNRYRLRVIAHDEGLSLVHRLNNEEQLAVLSSERRDGEITLEFRFAYPSSPTARADFIKSLELELSDMIPF